MDTSGQISMDFLMGISALLIGLIFLFQFLPGLISPFRSISDQNALMASSLGLKLPKEIIPKHDSMDPRNWKLIEIPHYLNRSLVEHWPADFNYLGLPATSHLNLSIYRNWSPQSLDLSKGDPITSGSEMGTVVILVNLSGKLRLLQISIW